MSPGITPAAGRLVWCWYGGEGGKTGRVIDAPCAIRRGDGRTVYEFSLPPAVLPRVNLATGAVLGFSWIANADDGDGYRGGVEWTPGMMGTKDSSQFGELLLK